MTWLALAAVFLNGILAGVFLGSCLVEQAARALGAADWLAYKQAKEALFGPVMPVFFGLVLLVSIAAAVVTPHRLAFAGASALLAVALAITVTIHLPLNTRFQGWTASDIPGDWAAGRTRWRVWNWVRGGAATVAFGVALASLA